MNIVLKSVSEPVAEKGYFYVTVAYTKDDKDETRKIYSFNKDMYEAIKKVEVGKPVNVTLKKNEKGYWEWAAIGESNAAASSTPAGKFTPRANSFETPEERARRQILIVRQSSLAQAVAFLEVGEYNVKNVLEIAAQFEEWVNRE